MEMIWKAAGGALYGMLFFYVIASLASGRLLRMQPYGLLLSMSATFLVAVVCEVGLGLAFDMTTGHPLWQYRVWPVHEGFTSALNMIVWPVYGYYLYLLAEVLRAHNLELGKRWFHGLLTGFDGPLLEILANGYFLLFYGTFFFYYFPDDLRHYTSVQVVPFYMAGGVLLHLILRYLHSLPRNWLYPLALYSSGCIFIITG